MNDEQWLAERRKGIGGSEAAAVCGVSLWRTPLSVYLDKKGLLVPEQPTLRMQLGLQLEPIIGRLYQEKTKREIFRPKERITWHPTIPWMFASLDYRAADDGRVIQIKTTSEHNRSLWGEPGSGDIPEQYLIQVHHEMECAGVDIADVPCLFGLSEFAIYTVRKSEALIEKIKAIEAEFWHYVESGTLPPAQWPKDSADLIDLAYRPVEKETHLGLNAVLFADEYQSIQAQITALERKKEAIRATITQMMGDASVGSLPDGRAVLRKLVHRDGYTVPPSEYVSFRITKHHKAKKEVMA